MENPLSSEEGRWALVATASTVIAGIAARKLLEGGWRRWRGENPPKNPEAPDVDWADAALWAGLTGAAVAVARLLARRGAAGGWERITGRLPPIEKKG